MTHFEEREMHIKLKCLVLKINLNLLQTLHNLLFSAIQMS